MSAGAVQFDHSFTHNGRRRSCARRLVYDTCVSSDIPLVVCLHGLLLDARLSRDIARLMVREAEQSGLDMSVRRLLSTLGEIEETVLPTKVSEDVLGHRGCSRR
jgi:hypothetical protein